MFLNSEKNIVLGHVSKSAAVKRITALWALSEGALGGLLHGLHIPLTGIFVGGAAVFFITLIAYFSEEKRAIIKATLIVLIVKGIVSPHTPPAAYFAVLLQGTLGQLLFGNKKYLPVSALILSITTLVYFSFQKLLVLTIVFGNTFWESIDVYTNFIFNQFYSTSSHDKQIQFSFILISVYVSLHIIAGIVIGVIAGRIPKWVNSSAPNEVMVFPPIAVSMDGNFSGRMKVRGKQSSKGIKRLLLIISAVGLIALTYFTPGLGTNTAVDLMFMSLRAVVITFIWYIFFAPMLMNYSRKYLKSRQNLYTEEIEEILVLLPHLKSVLSHHWVSSSNFKGMKKYKHFVSNSILSMLLINFNDS